MIFALALYLRRGCRGYVVFRRSRWGPFIHLLYGQIRSDGKVRLVSYVPASPVRRLLPPPIFRGRVRWGDLPP